ncbi:23S rRNA (guanosine(2251)-2'-O)-methyltransferase RlmB [Ancylobacter defluvii]|uniref:23S rRNA (Guanosine(2251)-2'-O)-methyltransferase RlmB n=1 Tax=Ancylobacter defluvii TaxID=1282440 RepID=A0A9W6NBA3_9HYPH|nr:23S rRNA (guanosine(2251)-2'-O)-methyltransferase RlmB [Ancylobacter defluvii]MBS7587042.1 23S rRNA (guanosine(2251)-2'-O)-methyltransferase RlmB [Ancylobacter defluvii]GLK84493.1 23S rRNA (guanosine(2251)-2'-O)-methyltransferase RlmB [Ancylobacter defluvii]
MSERNRPPSKGQPFHTRGGARGGASRGERPAGRPFGAWPDDVAILYGWHSVSEALRNPQRRIRRLLATENAIRRLTDEKVPLKLEPKLVRPGEIDRLLEADAVHQGLFAEADPLPSPSLAQAAESDLILVLDQITDPHNVGAIVRSAAALSVGAIVTTARHSPAATGVLAKSASGGLEHVPFCFVPNLARALDELKDRGVLVVGLDSEGAADLADTKLRAPLALVLGAEGKGLRQLTRQTCDVLARIDLPGAIVSLNVSNAAVLALHMARRAISRP